LESPKVLIVDDEESMRFLLREVMSREGYDTAVAASGEEALQHVREAETDLVIMDIKMPGMDGMQALREIRRMRPNLVVLMMTAHGNKLVALEAMREGAYDYFTKPFELDEMRVVVRRALEKQHLLTHITDLEDRLRQRVSYDKIIGQSDAMRSVYSLIEKVVTNDVTVLITGESGTGKELVAQAVHYHSRRKSKQFVSVNCAAIPENLLESELFGHERGAFTGAVATKIGRFEAAEGGSIFLDEIGDMPLLLQSKLLRALQEREIMRVGGTKPLKVDVRVIAATNKNLQKSVEEKSFREDLFFRLNVLPIHLPPLRKRQSDIPPLVEHFISAYNPRLNKNIQGVTADALQCILRYPWPGNVRELENVVQRSMVMSSGTVIGRDELPPNVTTGEASVPLSEDNWQPTAPSFANGTDDLIDDFSIPLQQKVEQLSEHLEKRIIAAALEKAKHHRQATADLLGISRKSLHNKMVKYQLFGEKDDSGASDV
jgi:nitrogen regulation protein NR(I)